MAFYAHSLRGEDRSKWQPLAAHLIAVARAAEMFARAARPADDDFARAAHLAGLLHDLGKYRSEFQAMLCGAPRSESTRHKQAGAARAFETKRPDAAFAIAGHHGGIPNQSDVRNLIFGPGGIDVAKQYWAAATADCPALLGEQLSPPTFRNEHSFDVHTRLLFSCLVDADWQDTAEFYLRSAGVCPPPAPPPLEPASRLQHVLNYIAERAKRCRDPRIGALRDEVLQAALAAAPLAPGIFKMSVPTGGAKTLSSLAFALAHAQAHDLRRVIYVAPFLSIIEQNGRELRRALGAENDLETVLEHHSLADLEGDNEQNQEAAPYAALRAEAWDAPVVVTTSVQFLESLFSNRPGRCRKLHNIARSVVILDECQSVPPGLTEPTVSMLGEFVKQAGCSLVLCTATQPAWERRPAFLAGLEGVREIAPAGLRLFERLKRVAVAWPRRDEAPWDWSVVASRMAEHPAALCVVNTKAAALAVYEELRSQGVEDALHLSTNMCPRHRLQVIDEVRRRLRAGDPCRLVSTQLIEAGVDIDFPIVFRELGPLEAIVQAAGRANREGLLNHADGTPGGRAVVFRSVSASAPGRWYEAGMGVVETSFLGAGREPDIGRPEDIEEYFRRLYNAGNIDEPEIEPLRKAQCFDDVAERYRLIDDATISVVAATWDDGRTEVDALLSQLERGWDRRLVRRLAAFQVNLSWSQQKDSTGFVAEGPFGFQIWRGPYAKETGLSAVFAPGAWVV